MKMAVIKGSRVPEGFVGRIRMGLWFICHRGVLGENGRFILLLRAKRVVRDRA